MTQTPPPEPELPEELAEEPVPELPVLPDPELPVLPELELPEPEPVLAPVSGVPVPELPGPDVEPEPGVEPEDPWPDPEVALPEPETVVPLVVPELPDPPEPAEPAEPEADVVSIPPGSADPVEPVLVSLAPTPPVTEPSWVKPGMSTDGSPRAAAEPPAADGPELGCEPLRGRPPATPAGGAALAPARGADDAGSGTNPPTTGA